MESLQEALSEILRCKELYASYNSDECVCPKCGQIAKLEWSGHWVKKLTAKCIGEKVSWCEYENACDFQAELDSVDNIEKALVHAGIIKNAPDNWRDGKVGTSGMEI